MLFWKITKGMIAVCTNQELLGCTLKVTRANLMNGLSWNATFQNPVTYLSHKGIEIHSHFILRGDSTLASAHVALWWKTKVMCEWFPGACRLSYAVMPMTFTAGAPCSGTMSEPRPEHGCCGLPRGSEGAGGSVLVSCAAFLHHCGHLALLGELFLRYPLEWQSMGIADCLFGCHWNSPALFLL